MSLLSALRVALAALLVRKGRSALTILGIVIGTAAVIAMVSAGESARRKLDERLDNVGKNVIVIRAGKHTQNGALADVKPLTSADAKVVAKQLKHILLGVAPVQITVRDATTRTSTWRTMIVGTWPSMKQVRAWTMEHGRYFTDDDVNKQAAVCLIGQTVRDKLFANSHNPVGKRIRIDRMQFRIIGVLDKKGKSPIGGDQDDQIFIPMSTMQKKLVGEERISLVLASVPSMELLEPAKKQIYRVLRKKRRVEPGDEDFDVSTVQEMAELAVIFTKTMHFLVGIIASISLVVGGIGIMNIMLVSVTERTREIGIRMAIGASGWDVLIQFLIEAVVLSLMGGLLGVLLGISGAYAVARVMGWPVSIDVFMVVLSFAISGGVGIFFGYYPALKASQLDPIDALRYE